MREFFNPWRRKIGVVTLGMALAIMALWIRSLTTRDEIAVRRSLDLQTIESGLGSIAWATVKGRAEFVQQLDYPPTSWRTSAIHDNNRRYQQRWGRKWRRSWGGVEYGEDTTFFENRRRLVIPYGLIVLPLTLFSAYLLLSKPAR